MLDTNNPHQVSQFLPWDYRLKLQLAAEQRNMKAIDAITDQLAAEYPKLVLPRDHPIRPEFVPRGR